MVTPPLPSWEPKTTRNCYIIPAFSVVPNAKSKDLAIPPFFCP